MTPTRLGERSIERMAYEGLNGSRDVRWDTEVSGFGVRVYPSGGKAYVLTYRNSSNRKKLMTLGKVRELKLKAARDLARELLSEVRHGNDPLDEKQAKRQEATFNELADQYLDYEQVRGKRSLKDDRQRLRDHIRPAIGGRRLTEITHRDLLKMQTKIAAATSNGTSNRCTALTRRMLNVAVEWGMLEVSPANKLKQLPESKPRDIFLSLDELQAIIRACDEDENIYAAALFKLAMFTGRRIGELKSMRWDQVDLETGVLTIPETKAGDLQRAYLNQPAIQVLASLPRVEGNPHVIVGRVPGQPLNAYRKSWDRILKRAGLEPFPPHGLRHSFASQLVVSGTPLETVGELLGHKSPLTTRKYTHFRSQHLKQAANAFGTFLSGQSPQREEQQA
jgi:integrase